MITLKKLRCVSAVGAMMGILLWAVPASATPIAYGLFIEGGIPPSLGGMGEAVDALYFENFSSSGEFITQVQIDLTTASAPGLFLDTTAAAPGDLSIFVAVALLAEVGSTGLAATTGDFDGSTLLTFDFTDFAPGEAITFVWDVDGGTIPYPPIPGEIIGEPDFTGATLTVSFSDGSTVSAGFVPRTDDDPVFSNEALAAVPEPSSLSLSLLGLAAAALYRRKRTCG